MLSEDLTQLHSHLSPYDQSGITMSGPYLRLILNILSAAARDARALETHGGPTAAQLSVTNTLTSAMDRTIARRRAALTAGIDRVVRRHLDDARDDLILTVDELLPAPLEDLSGTDTGAELRRLLTAARKAAAND